MGLMEMLEMSVEASKKHLTLAEAVERCSASNRAGWEAVDWNLKAAYQHTPCVHTWGGFSSNPTATQHCLHGKFGQLRCCICLTIVFDNEAGVKKTHLKTFAHLLTCKLLNDELGI